MRGVEEGVGDDRDRREVFVAEFWACGDLWRGQGDGEEVSPEIAREWRGVRVGWVVDWCGLDVAKGGIKEVPLF
jgi:hypothetical protein